MKIFYPVPYAAQKWGEYGLDETEINRLIADGELNALIVELPGGANMIIVADADIRALAAEHIDRSQFAHLQGVPISIGVAARKYNLTPTSLSTWVKQGHIKKIAKEGKRVLLDESDVAYACKRADVKGLKPGRSLF